MSKWLGILIQIILLAGQYENLAGSIVGQDWKWLVLAIIGALQVIAHAVQAHYNPDGSNSTVAYRK